MASAIITGAAQGIGAAHAHRFHRAGYRLVLNDRDGDRLKALAASLSRPAELVIADVAAPGVATELVERATTDGGTLDAVISNAGVMGVAQIADLGDDEWSRVIDTNLTGTFRLCREAARSWRDRAPADSTGHAALVLTTSVTALLGNPGHAHYTAGKAAIASLAQTLARELGPLGVTCNAIAPRAYTAMQRDTVGEFEPSAVEAWSPEPIAEFAEFLCGPSGSGITGQVFVVHGRTVALARPWRVTDPIRHDVGIEPRALLERVRTLFGDQPLAIEHFVVDDAPLLDPNGSGRFQVDRPGPPT